MIAQTITREPSIQLVVNKQSTLYVFDTVLLMKTVGQKDSDTKHLQYNLIILG